MKRFQFRLDRLLRLKEQRERQAELRQRQARVAWETARSEVSRLWQRLTQSADWLEAHVGRPVPSDPWIARCWHLVRIGQALDTAEAKVGRAAEHLKQVDRERVKIAAEVEALLHLRNQQWQEHRRDAIRTTQGQLDELVLRRWRAAHEIDERSSGP